MRYRHFNQVKTILALSGLIVCFALVARWLTLQD